MIRKECLKYYFSVEGQTEKWYLDWLQSKINEVENAAYVVKFDIKVEKNPKSRVKGITALDNIKILHVFDFEELANEQSFKNTLSYMKEASKLKRGISYELGYCNYTFDLWIILHKERGMARKNHRNDYLSDINRCYGTSFETMAKYKEEDNFKKLLNSLTLENVRMAIENAERITKNNKSNYEEIKYSGYKYFNSNPSLNLHEYIKKILQDTKIIS